MGKEIQDLVLISKSLRKNMLDIEKRKNPVHSFPERPDIYYEHGPCGTYPIIAFRTVPCNMYLSGYCSPCGYSARPYPENWDSSDYNESIMQQLDWILNNFKDVFVNRQSGQLRGYNLRKAPDRPWYMLQLSGASSFFRDEEISPSLRKAILERLIDFQDEQDVNLHVMLECRPEHIISAHNSGELRKLNSIFKSLDVVINMGLEYYDNWLRNSLFAKNLKLSVFEEAVKIAKYWRLDPGVFLFAGGFILTIDEILKETYRSLKYLENLGVFVNIMIPNIQDYTVPGLLWKLGIYELPEPYFLLDVVALVLDFSPDRIHAITPFNWFIGGFESDPTPMATLLNNPRSLVHNSTTKEIYSAFLELVKTRNSSKFLKTAKLLKKEPDFQAYKTQLLKKENRPRSLRLRALLEVARSSFSGYNSEGGGQN